MDHITIGSDTVPRLGYGCMGLTQAYQPVSSDKAKALLQKIAGDGPVMLDTAATYSGGKNEILVGSVLKTSREQVFLASKAGLYKNPDGSREIDGDPDRIIRSCDESLSRLGTDVIDLFYLHRVDHRVPVEESVGAIDQLISQGKVRQRSMRWTRLMLSLSMWKRPMKHHMRATLMQRSRHYKISTSISLDRCMSH